MMDIKEKLIKLEEETWSNAVTNIMPFWRDYTVDKENGGFYGAVGEDLKPIPNEPKSAVLNSRMLWGFANAYDRTGEEIYADLAKRAYKYLIDYFWDKQYGGVYWTVGPKGDPFDIPKRTYAQACFLYAVAEYYYVFRDKEAYEYMMQLVDIMVDRVRASNGGYRDSSSRDWNSDPWLNTWSMNAKGCPMLLNSHLHLFESYALIYKSTGSRKILNIMKDMLMFILDNCVEYDRGHLKAGMDENCNRIDTELNFGHDLECAYLMYDAAEMIEDKELLKKVQDVVIMLADNAVEQGIDPSDGGMNQELDCNTENKDKTKMWWVQCESITGLLCAYFIKPDKKYIDGVIEIWEYVKKYMLYEDGIEWRGVGKHAVDDKSYEKGDQVWNTLLGPTKSNKTKCPYHNSRAMFGVKDRVEKILSK